MNNARNNFFHEEENNRVDDCRGVKLAEAWFFKIYVGLVFIYIAAGCTYFSMLNLAMSPDRLAGFTADVEFWLFAIGVALFGMFGICCVIAGLAQKIRNPKRGHYK